jgi:hypothetical protein
MTTRTRHGSGLGPSLAAFARECSQDANVIEAFNRWSGLNLPVPITDAVDPDELVCFLLYVHKIEWPCVADTQDRVATTMARWREEPAIATE